MKITRRQLRRIIKEEMLMERLATVPQVQRMATDVGVRLSYGDAKTLAAQTQAERGALQALQNALQNGTWERIIRESIQDPGDDVFIEAILSTWDQVRIDVGIPNPTYEDKVDEVWAMLPTYEPEIARQLSALSMHDQNILFQAAFDVGHAPRYKNPAVDWLK